MYDMGDAMPLDDVHQARQVGYVSELDIDLVGDVGDQTVVAMARK